VPTFRRRYMADLSSAASDLVCDVSKQQVGGWCRGPLKCNGEAEWAPLLLFRLPELSQFIWGSLFLSEQQPFKEVDMFARNVSINLRPNTLSEFFKTMENEIVPLLQKQKGFQDEMTLSVPGGTEVVAVSFWDRKENAQSYDSSGYPKVLKILDRFLDRTPHVGTFEVVGSTLQKRATRDSLKQPKKCPRRGSDVSEGTL